MSVLSKTGFDCKFMDQPPRRSTCPICLLIPREPYQVTCCGKSFCRECIQQIKTRNKPCPTCNEKKFENYPDKGLKQELYACRVFCSNKGKGCYWQGELGQLEQHLNVSLTLDRSKACVYMTIKCIYCAKMYQRRNMKFHQISECLKRPFTCDMCKEFKSTYNDVTKNHAPSCKCRPVECPNKCKKVIEHRKLKEHLSNACPPLVECDFSNAGCNVKVKRKDLSSHLSESMVTHMSLLASENRRLNLELLEQKGQVTLFKSELERQVTSVKSELSSVIKTLHDMHVPPTDIVFPNYAQHKVEGTEWSSQPFYSHVGGYKLKLKFKYNRTMRFWLLIFDVLESEYEVKLPCKLSITVMIVDQFHNEDHIRKSCRVDSSASKSSSWYVADIVYGCHEIIADKHEKDDMSIMRVVSIETL